LHSPGVTCIRKDVQTAERYGENCVAASLWAQPNRFRCKKLFEFRPKAVP